MSREERKPADHDLHAYADGMLDVPGRDAVEAYLAAHPAAADEVEAWRRQKEALRALYGHVASEPVPPRLSAHRVANDLRARTVHWGGLAAAAVLLLIIGGAGGWFGRALLSPTDDLLHEAAAAHSVYVPEVTHPVEVWADQRDHLQAWLSKKLDRVLTVPDLRTEGLSLVGGRLLPTLDGPAAQFMYEDEGKRRVTLYIIPSQEGGETELRYAALGKLEAFFWSGEGVGCAVVGDLSRERLKTVATFAYAQME